MGKFNNFKKQMNGPYGMLVLIIVIGLVALGYFKMNPIKGTPSGTGYTEVTDPDDFHAIENGVHVGTGLIAAEGMMQVVNNCTYCHSAELVKQNRMNRERWIATIRWMQKTQNLRDLGADEEIIINYLVTNYPPLKKGRRSGLSDIEWYTLDTP